MTRREQLPRPDASAHWVGDEHPLRGPRQAKVLEDWGLVSGTRLLEVGCGNGRLAFELADRIVDGSYVGFDIGAEAIAWLEANYAPVLRNFRFDHLDVANPRWRPDGAADAAAVRFPYDDAAFDLVCVFDVFMHIPRAAVANYLREIRRVLSPGGRCVMTWVVIGPDEHEPVHSGRPYLPVGDGVHSRYPDRTDYALAYDRSLAEQLIADAGLTLVSFTEGRWHDKTAEIRGRGLGADLFVADAQ